MRLFHESLNRLFVCQGTADISCVVTIELTEDEVKRIKHDSKEYEDRKWVRTSHLSCAWLVLAYLCFDWFRRLWRKFWLGIIIPR
jgi:hypothetical protein